MNRALLSRRGFVSGAGGLTAAVLLAPEAMRRQARAAPEPARRRVRRGRRVGRSRAPRGITLWTRVGDVEGTGTVEVQVARDRGFRKVVARDLIKTSRRERPLREGARDRSQAVRGVLLPLRHPRRGEPGRALPHRAPARLEPAGALRLLLLPGLHVRLLQRPRAHGQGGPRLRGLPRRLHLRRGLLPDRPARAACATTRWATSETLDQYRAKYAAYRTDPSLRRMHARVPDDQHLGRPRGAGQLRRRRGPDGGLDPAARTTRTRGSGPATRPTSRACPRTAPSEGSQRIYRAARFGRNVDLLLLDSRSTATTSPAAIPFLGPACAELERAAEVPRAQPDELRRRSAWRPRGAAWKVVGEPADDHADLLPRRGHHQLRLLDGLSDASARSCVGHIKRKKIKDVVFVTGDIHTFVAGDVRLNDTDKRALATEFVGGSISLPGSARAAAACCRAPIRSTRRRPRGSSSRSRRPTPGSRAADFDHHGYGLAVATRKDFRCTLKRVAQIKKPGSKLLPTGEFHYRVKRGHPSIL